MFRYCDGTDPNLTRDVREDEESEGSWPDSVPCNCGRKFDDIYHSTIYPHVRIQPQLTDGDVDELIRFCMG
jgi:hypothetical protein